MQNKTLERITQHLIIFTASLDHIGLMNGKMGIALYFYHLSRFTQSKNHLAFANELANDVISKLDYKIPRTFFDGLIGLSWGFDHLARNNFVDFGDEDILTDLDQALLEINIAKLFDESFSTGLRGIAYYIVSRCSGKANIPAPFCKEYIQILYDRLNRVEQKDPLTVQIQNQLQQINNGSIIEYDLNPFYYLIGDEPYDDTNIFDPNRNIGIINNGYTGIALRVLKNMELVYEKNYHHQQ